jgi:hypothetical protein
LSRTRLSLVLTVVALLVAMGCHAALAQTTQPDAPPTEPTFGYDGDTDYYKRLTEALAALQEELRRVAEPHWWHFGDGDAIEQAREPVKRLADELNPNGEAQRTEGHPADATRLDSIVPRDQAEVDQRRAEADKWAGFAPRTDLTDQTQQDGWNTYLEAMKWLTRRLAEMAAKRAPGAVPAEPERPPAPVQEQVGLRPQASMHLTEEDPRAAVWRSAEEAGYWSAVLDRVDLTDDQRKAATKRSATAEAGLTAAKEKARGALPGDEIANLEKDGRDKGGAAGAAAEPSPEPPPAPTADELTETAKDTADGGAAPEQPAANLDQVTGANDGANDGDKDGGKEPLEPVTSTTLAPATEPEEPEGPEATQAPGGRVDPAQLNAGGDGAKGSAADWFTTGGDDDIVVGGTGGKLPPIDGCLGKVRTSTIDDCGTPDKLPPIDTPTFPGLEQGGHGEEDGCKAVAIAAFSTCGFDPDPKPDIFTPGPIDLPGSTGCGPVGVMAICTGTGGDLGGTRVTLKPGADLDRLFDQWGAPASPATPPPVQPGSASSLAA